MKNILPAIKWAAPFLAAMVLVSGCGTMANNPATAVPKTAERPEMIILREGDSVKVAVPSSPNLDSVQQIRRDGKITLTLIGEVDAAGLTPDELKQKLIGLYGTQITTKEITVTVQSSTFPVFVTGCVVHPGKVLSDHPMTALEAVMEAGGFDMTTANMRSVKITRLENGKHQTYKVNLKAILNGDNTTPFYLKPGDIIYVPERFAMF